MQIPWISEKEISRKKKKLMFIAKRMMGESVRGFGQEKGLIESWEFSHPLQ